MQTSPRNESPCQKQSPSDKCPDNVEKYVSDPPTASPITTLGGVLRRVNALCLQYIHRSYPYLHLYRGCLRSVLLSPGNIKQIAVYCWITGSTYCALERIPLRFNASKFENYWTSLFFLSFMWMFSIPTLKWQTLKWKKRKTTPENILSVFMKWHS